MPAPIMYIFRDDKLFPLIPLESVDVNGRTLNKFDTQHMSPDQPEGWMRQPDGTVQVMIHPF
jgi:hypothetical protein